MKVTLRYAIPLALSVAVTLPCSAAPKKKKQEPAAIVHGEVVIDAVVASVDDKPITLSDLCGRLLPPRKLTLSEAAKDTEAQKALDQMILEKLLDEEAKAKKVSVNDLEIEDYINEVAQRNGMTRGQFNEALAKEGKHLTTYKREVNIEILKAKIVSSITRGGVSTTETEVDEYISEHPELRPTSASVKLQRLAVSKEGRSPEEVAAKMTEIETALGKGDPFPIVAARLSDIGQNPEATSLGVIAESDLTTDISEAIKDLKDGEHSKPVESESEVQIFLVERRFSGEDEDDDEEVLRAEVRQIIQKQKTQHRLTAYFGDEIYKNHAVDKRL
jgi:peptidyl-prolyl cis-trans isomerase SurA